MPMIDVEKVEFIQNKVFDLKASSSKDEFLRLFAETTASTLNIYFVGIHLIDEARESLVFHAGNGLIGDKLLKYRHKVRLEKKSHRANQISPAAYNGEIRLVDWLGWKILSYSIVDNQISETNLEIISDKYFGSPNYPESRTELYLPLCVQGKTIGILELTFSVKPNFSVDEIQALQLLANKLAGLID